MVRVLGSGFREVVGVVASEFPVLPAGGKFDGGNNLLARNLRERVEVAERVQVVAEKFEPNRPRTGRRANTSRMPPRRAISPFCETCASGS